MKKLLNIFMSLAVFSLISGTFLAAVSPITVSAADACDKSFMGFPTWYRKLSAVETNPTTKANECVVKGPAELGMSIETYILQIGLNVIDIMVIAVGYLCAGFILFGGFSFILSSGDSDKMANARKTLLNASIGLVLCIASVAIVRFISDRLVA